MVLTNACIFYFFIAKSGTKTIAHLPIAEGLSFRSLDRRTIVNGEMKKKKHLIHVRSEFSLPTSYLVA
jgi:hypothetical protein